MATGLKAAIACAAALVLAGCATPTPNEVRQVPPVFSLRGTPTTDKFCECLLREADERVVLGAFRTPLGNRLVTDGDACEIIVGSSVPFAILRADRGGAEIRLMRDIQRTMDIYLSDHSFGQVVDGLSASARQCYAPQ